MRGRVEVFTQRETLIPGRDPTVGRPSGGRITPFPFLSTARARQLGYVVLLFPLHPAVLEPDFDLSLGETEQVRDLDAPAARQVAVVVELFLELQRLVASVRLTCSLRLVHTLCTRPHQRHYMCRMFLY